MILFSHKYSSKLCIIIRVISQQKTHFCLPTKVRFLNDVCLRQMMLASPMMTAAPNDAWLRHILGQTSHHCDKKEQHHICEANASYRRKAMHHLKIYKAYALIYLENCAIINSPIIKNLLVLVQENCSKKGGTI